MMKIMSNLFFDHPESDRHLNAKEKLFNLISEKKINITDNFENKHIIFKGENQDEFLHVESFIIRPENEKTYVNSAFFSNKDLPCVKYLTFKGNARLLCDQRSSYGAHDNLPCKYCLEMNLSSNEKNKTKIGYTPDVSFGYDGKHKVWLEILYTHACSDHKIRYCVENNIVLLEISVEEIENLTGGTLKFNNLTSAWKDTVGEMSNQVVLEMNKSHYIEKVRFKEKLNEAYFPCTLMMFHEKYNNFMTSNGYSEFSYYDNDLKERLQINVTGRKHLIVDDIFLKKVDVIKEERLQDAAMEMHGFGDIIECRVVDYRHAIKKDIATLLKATFKLMKCTDDEKKKLYDEELILRGLVEDNTMFDYTIIKYDNDGEEDEIIDMEEMMLMGEPYDYCRIND